MRGTRNIRALHVHTAPGASVTAPKASAQRQKQHGRLRSGIAADGPGLLLRHFRRRLEALGRLPEVACSAFPVPHSGRQSERRCPLLFLAGRKKQKLAKERAGLSKLPDLKDAEAVQKFFLEEIQLGEELLAQGEYEKGVDHLTNAIAVCGQPQQLLQVLQQTLPPPVFQMLLTKLPTISQRIVSAQSLAEDDVE
ncbi:mitochondrial import receptor subunit TOM20 homolog [Rhinolophus sinicus]|uniref:mitochondrial import receptor subunit TOM20 homolog n=1 Tax=Rhinolophus sinicus TaxID=89399 RepID=UPI003D7A0F61